MKNIDFNAWTKLYSNGSPVKQIGLNGQQVSESEYKDQEWTHKVILFDSGINGFYTVDFSYYDTSQKTKYETIFDQILSTFKFSLGLEAQIKLCTDTGATWLKQYKECEGPGNMISETDCLKNKGEYFKCTSPCRHNPQAEQCETVCMKVCKF